MPLARARAKGTPTVGGAPEDQQGQFALHPPVFPGPRVHLIVGPVGAGKSTFAGQLASAQRALWLNLDDWMVRLFRPDRPEVGVIEWYVERARRAVEQIEDITARLGRLGISVVLELGLLRRLQRELFYQWIAAADLELTIHVVDAAREVRRERVLGRNRDRGATFVMHVPPEVFERASDLWEPVDADEARGKDVRFLRTDTPAE
jgi:predicted kinase